MQGVCPVPPVGAATVILIGICTLMPAGRDATVVCVSNPELASVEATSAPHPLAILTASASSNSSIPHGIKSVTTTSVASTDPWLITVTKNVIGSPTVNIPLGGTLAGSTVLVSARSNIGSVAGSLSSSSVRGSSSPLAPPPFVPSPSTVLSDAVSGFPPGSLVGSWSGVLSISSPLTSLLSTSCIPDISAIFVVFSNVAPGFTVSTIDTSTISPDTKPGVGTVLVTIPSVIPIGVQFGSLFVKPAGTKSVNSI